MRKDRILKLCGPPDEKPDAAKRGVVTQAGRKRIRAKTGGTCHVCGGRAGKRWHADHVKPRRLGGKSEESNYLPTCQECNRLRWGYPPEVRCFRHQLLLPRPYLVLTKQLRLDIQCQRAASVKIVWKYLDD